MIGKAGFERTISAIFTNERIIMSPFYNCRGAFREKRFLWVAGFILALACTGSCRQGVQRQEPVASGVRSTADSSKEENAEISIADLKRLYNSAQSVSERRELCFRAIDAQVIYRGKAVSIIDEIMGTHFAADLPEKEYPLRWDIVYFDEKLAGSTSNKAGVFGEKRWSLHVWHDREQILSYRITDLPLNLFDENR
jgi:hypothetical protein